MSLINWIRKNDSMVKTNPQLSGFVSVMLFEGEYHWIMHPLL